MIDSINYILTLITDYILLPFQGLSKVWGLIFLSVLAGVILLLCYGKVSNQNAIRSIKRKIMAAIYESVLYRRNLRLCLKAQWKMLCSGAVYFALAVPPIIVLMIPCILMLAQMNLRYESNGLYIGEPTLLRVKLDNAEALNTVGLETSENVSVTPALHDLREKEVVWRLTPQDKNPIDLKITNGSEEYKYFAVVDDVKAKHLPAHYERSWYNALLYPGLKKVPANSAISEISLAYPGVSYQFCGISWHWLVLFLIVSILSGLVAAKIFGVAV